MRAAYARIGYDDRHANMTEIVSRPIEERAFGQWAMLHDPAATWMWTHEQVAQGALEKATAEEVRAIFTKLSTQV